MSAQDHAHGVALPLGDPQPELSPEAQARFLDQVMSVYVLPEIEARQARGDAVTVEEIWGAQVVFEVDQPTVVRLNHEVRGTVLVARADPSRAWTLGEEVTLADIGPVSHVELPEGDANAAHITLLVHTTGISISFDATYNKARIAAHLEAAAEFIASATADLAEDRLRPFAENAFHAAEHLARAELLPLPDERFLKAKTHGAVVSRLHWWSRLGNIDADAARLLSDLERARQHETYVVEGRRLTREAAEDLHCRLLVMRDGVDSNAPRRGASASRSRAVKMVAAKRITPGQLVRPSDNQTP